MQKKKKEKKTVQKLQKESSLLKNLYKFLQNSTKNDIIKTVKGKVFFFSMKLL